MNSNINIESLTYEIKYVTNKQINTEVDPDKNQKNPFKTYIGSFSDFLFHSLWSFHIFKF